MKNSTRQINSETTKKKQIPFTAKLLTSSVFRKVFLVHTGGQGHRELSWKNAVSRPGRWHFCHVTSTWIVGVLIRSLRNNFQTKVTH